MTEPEMEVMEARPCPVSCGPFANPTADYNAKQVVTLLWVTIHAILAILFICILCVVGQGGPEGHSYIAFFGMWTLLISIILGAGGTMVLRQYQKAFNIGFFLGVTIMVALNMFVAMVIFADAGTTADTAASVFCFFLFVAYTAFCIILAKYRNEVIVFDEEVKSVDEQFPANEIVESNTPAAISV